MHLRQAGWRIHISVPNHQQIKHIAPALHAITMKTKIVSQNRVFSCRVYRYHLIAHGINQVSFIPPLSLTDFGRNNDLDRRTRRSLSLPLSLSLSLSLSLRDWPWLTLPRPAPAPCCRETCRTRRRAASPTGWPAASRWTRTAPGTAAAAGARSPGTTGTPRSAGSGKKVWDACSWKSQQSTIR